MMHRVSTTSAPGPFRLRWRLLLLLLPLLPAALGSGCGAPPPPPSAFGKPSTADPGAQFRGGAAHPGAYDGAPFAHLGSVAWVACTGGAVRSSPAVAGGVVYVGSGDGLLRALDLETGATRWEYDAGAPIASSPARAGDRVVVVSRDGVAHGVSVSDGGRVWRMAEGPPLPMPWGPEGWDYFTASPTVTEHGVLLAGADGVLRRVAAADGALLGETTLGTRLRSSPAYAEGRAFVGGADGVVYAVDVPSGRIAWRHATEGASLRSTDFGYDRRTVQSSPAVADGRVFVGGRDGRLYALDADTGARLWVVEYAPSWVVSSPAVGGGTVYTGTSDALRVEALDAATGERRWGRDLGTRVLGSPSLVGGVLLAPGNDGWLTALDADTGETLWRYRAGSMIQSSPVVAGDLALIGDDAGALHALRAGAATPRLAVFHDPALARLELRPGAERLADDLERAGYERIDAPGLERFLADRLEDGASSVVVFAQDHVPGEVDASDPGDAPDAGLARAAQHGLLRRYLEAGGKVVWLGYPPRSVVRDTAGRPTAFEPGRSAAVAGVSFAGADGSDYAARPTLEGRRWGLDRVRLSAFAPDSAGDVGVLARDELGRPVGFVRSFGGAEGTGFVFLWGQGYRPDMLPEVRRVAEHGVLTEPAGMPRPAGACPAGLGTGTEAVGPG